MSLSDVHHHFRLLSNKNGANNPRYIALLEVKLKKEPGEYMAALAAKRLKMAADYPLTYPSLFPPEGSVVTFPSGVVHRWDDRVVTVQRKDVAAFVKMKNPKITFERLQTVRNEERVGRG
ncbi:hypothetical protein CEUSTIGMA_g11960.t1 [Chlamydomonas eustigma]|uniref:Uncharacterized protein n=1 Tax=Chlamydomonas eustigma TaxID=1157962 RepID=A0A250XNM0_9CHLO|nr:hypothetical protein CEUSTIGMA_g11960.t1 [Chlamydomonas eustigma]|eukprot:GAX84539.1 hypothetical protein CEUSTIGMA_g11960.t1 [Chlamydomonas eustigma]